MCSSQKDETDSDEDFTMKEHSTIVELLMALWFAILSHTDFVCYLIVFMTQVNNLIFIKKKLFVFNYYIPLLDKFCEYSFPSIATYGIFLGNFNYSKTNQDILGYVNSLHTGTIFGSNNICKRILKYIFFLSLQIVVLLKCVSQFDMLWWNQQEITPNQPLAAARILGIEKKKGYATYDLALLLILFFHR